MMAFRFISGRSILMVVIVCVGLAIGVYLNVTQTEPPLARLQEEIEEDLEPPVIIQNDTVPSVETTAKAFRPAVSLTLQDVVVEYQLQREQSRSAQMELLREVAANPEGAPVVRQEAELRLLKLARLTELEVDLTGLLRSEGFDDPIVVAGDHGITISVSGRTLTQDEAAKVGNLAAKMSGFDLSKIVILERSKS